MHFWVWLALAGIFVVLEILTMSLIFASFALAALIAAFFAGLWIHSIAAWLGFAVASVLTLGILRPIARKYLFSKNSESRTGIDALIGALGVCITEVNTEDGRIRLQNETWSARSVEGSIDAGVAVTVMAIDGAVALVLPASSNVDS
ncbi:MAG: NfeD family protein [Actinobacteria bacterium]|nr:NfeD family protein [Actinomycetota bacterium]